jgi:hypothetical protein
MLPPPRSLFVTIIGCPVTFSKYLAPCGVEVSIAAGTGGCRLLHRFPGIAERPAVLRLVRLSYPRSGNGHRREYCGQGNANRFFMLSLLFFRF